MPRYRIYRKRPEETDYSDAGFTPQESKPSAQKLVRELKKLVSPDIQWKIVEK